jgi:phosphoglycerate dehydrogenase-like enzyme
MNLISKRKILFLPRTGLARDILSQRAREILNSLGEVVWNPHDRDYTAAELAGMLPGVEAVVTSWGCSVFTSELLAIADRLRIVGHAAGTVKNLMPEEGYRRGIVVLSAAAVIADSVAEYTLWAMLTGQRNLLRYEPFMKRERGWKTPVENYGHELYHKKVGIVSASMIGRRVIKLLKPFECDVIVYDPYLSDEEAQQMGARRASLEQLFATSDIVSIHAPTTPETKKMIQAQHFRSMQDGALLVHTARTWVLDEDALLAELRTGRIHAVIDVFEREPLAADHPLRDLENVFLTPHISGHTTESRARLVERIADSMRQFFAGEKPALAVPPERLKIMA